MSYPEEEFEKRLKRFKAKARTKLPHQVEFETALRVNRLAKKTEGDLSIPVENLAKIKEDRAKEKLPADLFNIHIIYDESTDSIKIEGPAGSPLISHDTCIIELTKNLVSFSQSESCGECTFCRIGTKRMLEILERICSGKGNPEDLELLKDLAEKVKSTSLCEVAKNASNPVIITIEHCQEDYIEHIYAHNCRAGKCSFK
ncbi:MAG: hypothetical protein D6734_09925 [Candidatus Schekmanbacteria bacterium]|nr:MAG: hypothetical protein D6734_09925 [Candidatus Schekmanbacteria bacterium]